MLIAGVIYVSYYTYVNYPRMAESFKNGDYNFFTKPEVNASGEIIQFYPNMRFNHNNISYFVLDCSDEKITRLERAFSIINNETQIISFYEAENEKEADIRVGCTKNSFQTEENTFVAGEGGPTSFMRLEPYSIIIKGKVVLYKEESCDYPITELHELFHVFGFDHVNKSDTIMYPYVDYKQKIDPELISMIKAIYSIEPKAELYFSNVSSIKRGIYLDYTLEVNNDGLIDAKNVKLDINSDKGKVESSKLKNLGYGTGQKLWTTNMKLPSLDVKKIIFRISSDTPEYNTDNNVIEVSL